MHKSEGSPEGVGWDRHELTLGADWLRSQLHRLVAVTTPHPHPAPAARSQVLAESFVDL